VCDRENIGVVCVGHQFMTCEIHECMATVIGTMSAKSEVASYTQCQLRVKLPVIGHCTESSELFCGKKATNLDSRENTSKISLI